MTPPLDPERTALERALGAQYEIGRLLGRGGMGAVYLARETALERPVAIKVLPPDLAADAESRERFRREARTAAKLTHPNIVPLHTFGDAEGMLYFVMGYVRGESLGDRMRREGRMAEAEVRRILAELADALDYAHRQGVIHRDIKPDNVLLDDESGRPMLTDFGVARARAGGATLTEAGAVVGTAHYMSPEQASGARDLDGRSDLYSLGVMGYAMLSGRLPFEGATFRDVIVQHVTQAPPPLGALVADAPAALVATISRCLAKSAAERWPDGRTLREALTVEEDESQVERPFWVRTIDGTAAEYVMVGAAAGLGALIYPLVGDSARLMFRMAAAWTGLALMAEWGFVAWLRWRGRAWTELRQLLLRPPTWWPLWWPNRWRREHDVWDRLPRILKAARIVNSIAVLELLVFTGSVLYLMGLPVGPSPAKKLLGWLIVGQALLIPPVVLGNGLLVEIWARKRGLKRQQVALAASGSTTAAFWKQRTFAALLAPPAGRAAAGAPRTPQDYVRAIADAAAQLAGPVREAGSDATSAARQLVGALEALDAEIVQLARDANPTELAQVEQKLAASGDAAGDNDARRKMRALLEGQRDLLRGLADQLSAATQRRAQLTDLLKTLWLQVASLRAEVAREALGAGEVTGRIRALCEEISRHATAAAEVRAIAPGNGT